MEDEFASRDKMGLEPPGEKTKSEAQTRKMYLTVTSVIMFLVSPSLAIGLLWLVFLASRNEYERHQGTIALLREYDLGWVYLSWYAISLARAYATINANGARAAARVGRPDQHAYRIMASSKKKNDDDGDGSHSTLAGAPYVLMENVGPVGRFNRAQRAASHMDEGLGLLLFGILLGSVVVPRTVFCLSVVYAAGRVRWTNDYTESLEGRMGAMIVWVIPQYLISSFVGIFAVQALVMSS